MNNFICTNSDELPQEKCPECEEGVLIPARTDDVKFEVGEHELKIGVSIDVCPECFHVDDIWAS